MFRPFLIVIILIGSIQSFSQPFGNEWIDYSKPYYKFPVRLSQLCRIPKATLVAANLGDIPAENFQLWRNGKEVPIYITQASGPLATDGFIEFSGSPNDGKEETSLYTNPAYHPSDKRSLFSDTAWYYLTQHVGTNARILQTANDVAATTLKADSLFNYDQELFVPGGISEGYAMEGGGDWDSTLGRYVNRQKLRSSAFDQGEGVAYSRPFNQASPFKLSLANMRVHPSSTPITIKYTLSGNAEFKRDLLFKMNDSLLDTKSLTGYEMVRGNVGQIPLSRILNDGADFTFTSNLSDASDLVYVNTVNIAYQRRFNFNNSTASNFILPANNNGNHIRMAAFRHASTPPILYDFTNGKRYTGVIKSDSSFFLLAPSATDRNVTLMSAGTAYMLVVPQLLPVTFVDYTQRANQADFIIISNHRLYDYNGHNYVEDYRAYRASNKGGSYNAKTFDIDDLADQFSFGQRKNPLAIKNFIKLLLQQSATGTQNIKPRYVFLIGRGAVYNEYKLNGSVNREILNAVPTFGSPASDNLLVSADNLNSVPLVPIGRISVISGAELSAYLEKVKQYEALASAAGTADGKEWKKEVIQVVGADDAFLSSIINNFMKQYTPIIVDTLVGARVKTYVKFKDTIPNPNYAVEALEMKKQIDKGVGLITYFGHQAAFNFDNPEYYTYTAGKYPIFIANGCETGNAFDLKDSRFIYAGLSLPDQFLLYPNKGAIAFIAGSDFGIPNYLNIITAEWYRAASRSLYASGLGDINQLTIKNTMAVTGTNDFYNRRNCEQFILHADPSLIAFPSTKPDLTTNDNLITITPFTSVAADSLNITARFYNVGKGIRDSVWVELKREYPDGRQQSISKKIIRGNIFKSVNNRDSASLFIYDSITARVAVKGVFDQGTNYIIATIDPANEQDEMSEANNEGRKSFEVSDEEILPVYPYKYAIVNQPNFLLTGSTANPLQEERTYRLQFDTTELFNSSLLYTKDTNSLGGAVSFIPPAIWKNGTVYYWRLAPVISGQPVNWRYSSFQYLTGAAPGFGQSHYFQHQKSVFEKITLDSTRQFGFGKNIQNLFMANCVYINNITQSADLSFSVNGIRSMEALCKGTSIIFHVFDTISFKPWVNTGGMYGSVPLCNKTGIQYNFEFQYNRTAERKKIMDFLDSIPKGMIVGARMILASELNSAGKYIYDSSYAQYWKNDTVIYGPGKSLYHSLYNQGFSDLDSLNKPSTLVFLFRKDDSVNFRPIHALTQGLYDKIKINAFIPTDDTVGQILSPIFGPAKEWKELQWQGHEQQEILQSTTKLQLIGIDSNGKETILKSYQPTQWVNDISDVNAAQYPRLRLKLLTKDAEKAVPYQLDYWRLFYTPVPDGALSALDYYTFNKSILLTGSDTLQIKLAFKNVSKTWLDSTSVKVRVGDKAGNETTYTLPKLKPLNAGDTAIISFSRNTDGMDGVYYAHIAVNEEEVPLEQHQFNNFAYIPFEVASTLPISQVDLNAKAEQNAVRINWFTSFETEIASYTLEFGTNTGNLNAIATVAAKNDGTASTSYTWLHTSPATGVNYYRIKITHQSGKVEYTSIRQVLFEKGFMVSVYPNPFLDKLKIVITDSNQSSQIELFNIEGKRLMTKKFNGSCILNTQHLPAGFYTLKLNNSGSSKTIMLEKQ